jgi:hypothetical protein
MGESILQASLNSLSEDTLGSLLSYILNRLDPPYIASNERVLVALSFIMRAIDGQSMC